MPLRDGFDYPLPKTLHAKIPGGKSVFAGEERGKVIKNTPMMTPGPQKYNPNKIASCLPNIRGGTLWKSQGPRFKADGVKTDMRNYTPIRESTRPKWTVPKGRGHVAALIKGCGADAFYDVKKDYCDCATVGEGGVLVQGAVQGLGTRVKKVADFKARSKSQSRIQNYPKKPGPGTYEVAAAMDKVLPRAPVFSQTKMELDKARFPGSYVREKAWVPPPGHYKDDQVTKTNKGAQYEQQLGRNSSFSFGAS